MTNSRMALLYVEEARGRVTLVRVALEKGPWAATVREAQECVELFLKGALRLSQSSRRGLTMSPRCSGPAFYDDEREEFGPQELFDEADARRAVQDAEIVAQLCEHLLSELI